MIRVERETSGCVIRVARQTDWGLISPDGTFVPETLLFTRGGLECQPQPVPGADFSLFASRAKTALPDCAMLLVRPEGDGVRFVWCGSAPYLPFCAVLPGTWEADSGAALDALCAEPPGSLEWLRTRLGGDFFPIADVLAALPLADLRSLLWKRLGLAVQMRGDSHCYGEAALLMRGGLCTVSLLKEALAACL